MNSESPYYSIRFATCLAVRISRMRYLAGLLLPLLSVVLFTQLESPAWAQSPRPNIVLVFVDDLGWGGVGFNNDFGHTTAIKTPNLDQMASDGLRFTRAYSATVCSPSRGMLMTGLNQAHNDNDRNVRGFLDEDVSVATVLKGAGYSTALYGKWGFGATSGTSTSSDGTLDLRINPTLGSNPANFPSVQGFDAFLGYMDHTQAHYYFVDPLWEIDPNSTSAPSEANDYNLRHYATGNNDGQNQNTLSAYSDAVVQQRAEQYIADHAGDAEPFYLQLNYNIPHADFDAIVHVPDWDTPYQDDPTWATWTDKQRKYAAMVTMMDKHFGQLMAKLADPDGNPRTDDGIEENTLVIFTSDNGSDPGDGLNRTQWDALESNGALLGGKRDLYEGGIRVPMAARWTGVIPAGGETDFVTDLTDFLPTAAALAGVDAPVGIDGVSIVPILTGEGIQRVRPYHVWEHHNLHGVGPGTKDRHPGYEHLWAIEKDGIKLIKLRNMSSGELIYELLDIQNDPLEKTPLSLNGKLWQDVKDELQAIAVAEGLDQPVGYHAVHRTWVGSDGADLFDAANWTGTDPEETPDARWMAVVNNLTAVPAMVTIAKNADFLGLEVRGEGASQTLRITQGAQLTGRNEIRIAAGGVIDIDNGSIDTVRWVDVLPGGKLSGTGQINGQVYNAGEVTPGASPGRFVVQSDFIQLDSGLLTLEVGGAAAESGFDQLAIAGQAHLDGVLTVELIDGFHPESGDFFPLIVAEEITGDFDGINLPEVPGGPSLTLMKVEGALLLVADALPLAGDLNRDGQLNQLDIDAFVSGWQMKAPAGDMETYARGDLNYDGQTDRDDWYLLRKAFIAGGQGNLVGATVPEPSTLSIIGTSTIAVVWSSMCRRTCCLDTFESEVHD